MAELRKIDNGSYICERDPGEPTTSVGRVSITDEEGRHLAELVEGLTVLEIGTGLGVSTGYLASTAKRVLTVDVDPWVHENIWPTLPENVETYAHSDLVTEQVDAVFIDGDHTRDGVKRDLETAARVCPGGRWIAHDTNVLRQFAEWRQINTTHGLGVLDASWA